MTEPFAKAPLGLKGLIRQNGQALWVFSILTLTLPLGMMLFLGIDAERFGVSFIGALSVMCFWTALATPAAAAGGKRRFSCWLRGAMVLDINAMVLLAIWLLSKRVGLNWPILPFVWIYLILTSQGIASLVLVSLPKAGPARLMMSVFAAILGIIMLVSPFYMAAFVNMGGNSGPLWAVRINPFWSSCQTMVEQTHVYWQQEGMLYEMFDWMAWDRLLAMREVAWWQTTVIYIALATLFLLLGIFSHMVLRRFKLAERPAFPPMPERPGLDG